MLRRRRGRRPKIDKLLEASALESMIAANSGAAGLAGSLTPAGLTTAAGLNMLWPVTAGFEQCLSRLADANMAERSRLLLGDSGLLVTANNDSLQTGNEQPPKSVAGETSGGGSLDLRSLPSKDELQHAASRPPSREPEEPSADIAVTSQQPNDVRASEADAKNESTSRDADSRDANLALADETRASRATTAEHHSSGHVEEATEQPLKLTAASADHSKDVSMTETPSQNASRQSAAEDDSEDVMNRLRGSDDAVARWLAEHRNAFDRPGLEDEVQSEVTTPLCIIHIQRCVT